LPSSTNHPDGAQCLPDFFGFNAHDELQYRGRLDALRMTSVANAPSDLYETLKQVAGTRPRPFGATALDGMFDQVEGPIAASPVNP
jgi:hypothetical protein